MIHQFIGKKVRYDTWGGGYIWGESLEGGEQMIAQVEDKPDKRPIASIRGWGAIQHLFKNGKEAALFQDDLGKWIAEAINEKLERERNETKRGDTPRPTGTFESGKEDQNDL